MRFVAAAVIAAMLACWSPLAPFAPAVGADTVDGTFDGGGRLPAGEVFDLTVVGRGGVPATGVGSVALNVTVANPWEAGHLTVWPTGQPRPTASNLNVVRAQTVPNMVMVPVGAGGQVSFFLSAGSADVIVDVLGWFPAGGGFTGLTPARLLDTRAGGTTVDGAMSSTGSLQAGAVFDLPVRGRGGVPAVGAGSVVLNVTLTGPTDATYLTVWPSGAARPTASNLNVAAGETRPNLVVAPLGATGDVSLYLYSGSADVVVDVLGWFADTGGFTGVTPSRVMDSRDDGVTVDGSMRATGVVRGDAPVVLPIAGRGGVPATPTAATSVVLNVTVTEPTDVAFLTVHPSGTARPNASNLNVLPGRTAPNLVMVPLGADGAVSLYLNRGAAHVVVDVLGYATGTDVVVGVTPGRLLDTRGAAHYVPLPAGVGIRSLVFDGSSLWSTTGSGGLVRIDPASGFAEEVSVPGRTTSSPALFADGQFLWMKGDGDRRLVRFEPATGRATSFPLVFGMVGDERPSLDGRYLWLTNRHAITRLDRFSGAMRVFQVPTGLLVEVSDAIPVSAGAFDGRYVWFGARLFGTDLGRFDTATGRFDAVPLPDGLRGIGPSLVSDGRRVWTATSAAAPGGRVALVWFDAAEGTSGTIEVPAEVWAGDVLYADGSSVWVTSTWVAQIARVDVATGTTTLLDGESLVDPRGAIAGPERFLVSVGDGNSVWAWATVSGALARFPIAP